MPSLVVLLCVLLTFKSSIQAKGTKPSDNFGCSSLEKPKLIAIIIETGSELFAGTDDKIRLLLLDSDGGVCTAGDLNNSGNDHERNSIDHYALCCPQDFAKGHDSLRLLLLSHGRGYKGAGNDWFIEHIEVHMKGIQLLKYRFHVWTNPYEVAATGVSIMSSSRSKNGIPSYTLVRL